METIDFNGQGQWSEIEIRSRYARYAVEAGISPRDVSPKEHTEGQRHWVYPVMDKITDGIEAGDPACARIGIEFIEEDQSFPFGRILKARAARALRRAPLTHKQKERILRRIFGMLRRGYVPHEFREYSKLARRIGFGIDDVPKVDLANPFAVRYYQYFVAAASQGERSSRPHTD